MSIWKEYLLKEKQEFQEKIEKNTLKKWTL